MLFRLNDLSIVDVVGKESDKILHNLTTNHVRALKSEEGCETFVTDARGKTIGHFIAYRNAFGFRLIGAAGQSARVVAHLDRYTIREDSVPSALDEKFATWVISRESFERLGISLDDHDGSFRAMSVSLGTVDATLYEVNWIGGPAGVILSDADRRDEVETHMQSHGVELRDATAFHRERTLAFVPWYGVDLDESNLPQEADRDAVSICFTKGCYLGQETVARLDALGQVQKKLVRWRLEGDGAVPGMTLADGDKTVARLTSVAVDDQGNCFAIAMTRRSHFDPGATATHVKEDGTGTIVGTVVE